MGLNAQRLAICMINHEILILECLIHATCPPPRSFTKIRMAPCTKQKEIHRCQNNCPPENEEEEDEEEEEEKGENVDDRPLQSQDMFATDEEEEEEERPIESQNIFDDFDSEESQSLLIPKGD